MTDLLKLSDETFRTIRDFVYKSSGIFIQDSKKYLVENRLQRHLRDRNIANFEDYARNLSRTSASDLADLFDLITTRETSFFREPLLLEAFGRELLPQKLAERGRQGVKIWSAGCSTGEEPYTLAIYLLEQGGAVNGTPIYATDISRDAISRARAGVYGEYALRNTGSLHIRKYFVKTDGGLGVSPEVRRLVRFEELNLIDESRMARVRGMDFIFCRNVMIYFDEAVKKKVTGFFHEALNPGGYLIIGASESIHSLTQKFRPVNAGKAVVYRKN